MLTFDELNAESTSENKALEGAAPSEAVAGVSSKTVVVVPFVDDSPARDQEYFCRGTAEEIIYALMNLNVAVLAPNHDAPFGTISDARRHSRERNGAITVSGSVRKLCNLYRINILLVDTESDRVLWSGRLDRSTVDVLSFQEEIARTVVTALSDIAVQSKVAGEPKSRR